MKIFYLLTMITIALASWQFLEQDLVAFSVSRSNWSFQNTCDWSGNNVWCPGGGGGGSCTWWQKGQCPANALQYLYIGQQPNSIYYSSNNALPPHYQAKLLIDGYFLDATGNWFTVTFDVQGSSASFQLQYKNSQLDQYQNDCDTTFNRFDTYTFIMTFDHNNNNGLNFRICTSNFDPNLNFGIRNFQIFVNPCHWSCLTCSSGNGPNNCLSCFNPAVTLSSQSACSNCPTNTAYIEYIDSSKKCTTECHYYRIPDSNKVCQFNELIQPYKTYFASSTLSSTSPWVLVPDPINYNIVGIDRTNPIPCQTTKDYVGPFYYNEGLQLTMSLPYNITYIRFRVTIIKLGSWPDYTSVQILLDDIEQASVYSVGDVIQDRNADNSYFDQNCTSPVVTFYRIETKLRTNFTTPILKIKGNMDQYGLYSWGFKNVVIDYMGCQSSCTWCDFDTKCYACSGGLLHKNRCVLNCPPYSLQSGNKCIDFDEASANSIYLIKAFYDSTNTTDTDVANIVGSLVTGTGTNDFQTSDPLLGSPSVYFGYYNGIRVLGGPLIWNSAKFTKTFTSLNPHYQYNLKFTLILGDGFNGDFQYEIGGYAAVSITTSGFANVPLLLEVGTSSTDKFKTIDITQTHTASSLTITLFCNSNQQLKQNFCLIYDYFLILQQCIEYCTACTGPTWALCTTKQTLPTGMSSPTSCVDNTYYLDTTVSPAVCRTCAPSYCLQCSSANVCTLCATNYYIVDGICLCLPWTYQTATYTCVSCHSQCQQCYGPLINNCLSCYDSQHRSINNNKCQCQAHYYDDGINDICQSICGDMVVTEGEDCDDGNTIRYDGCNNCQYECQVECQVCIKGRCSVCVTGYTLHPVIKICYPTCGDNKIVNQEQCEDNNLTPYDGCFRCQFQCQSQCTNCIDGICYQCDNTIGYYLNTINQKCVTICGDQIIARGESCDDGNNDPYDGCLSCFFACDSFCSNCIQGVCAKCKSGYQLLNQTNQCEPICGDGILAIYESCDDGK